MATSDARFLHRVDAELNLANRRPVSTNFELRANATAARVIVERPPANTSGR
jgi:hypothetical protein